jgi:hypothetical protein
MLDKKRNILLGKFTESFMNLPYWHLIQHVVLKAKK